MNWIIEKGWEVEWCTRLLVDENGDAQYDASDYEIKDFLDEQSAMEFAKKIAPKADGIQCARVRQFKKDRYGYTDFIGDGVEVSA